MINAAHAGKSAQRKKGRSVTKNSHSDAIRVAALGSGCAGLRAGDRVFAMKPHGSHTILRPDDSWVPLPDSVGDEDAVAIALTATALHAVERADLSGVGVAVAGLGALGFTLSGRWVPDRSSP